MSYSPVMMEKAAQLLLVAFRGFYSMGTLSQ